MNGSPIFAISVSSYNCERIRRLQNDKMIWKSNTDDKNVGAISEPKNDKVVEAEFLVIGKNNSSKWNKEMTGPDLRKEHVVIGSSRKGGNQNHGNSSQVCQGVVKTYEKIT